ncbi:MAG: bifunctional SulP family inorganic anion transporter/carbonic anhydrase [Planctomycetes bacterium]|nr:bifunctional SulP family inorganic anion transporter/carbonic anhydrase [Planctomycetota bacterium]
MAHRSTSLRDALTRDLAAGLVVFLVALPLCLGVALASGAPLFSGLLAGVIGGVLVGLLSGSHTSVSGPAAGLTAIVATQLATLGSFEAFLAAVALAGVMQIALGVLKGGFVAAFFPTSVIKGLLAAIGLILVLKQIPHVFGHDTDPVGEMAFAQPDAENTFSELWRTVTDVQPAAALIGIVSLLALWLWGRSKVLKRSPVPAPLVIVLGGVAASYALGKLGGDWVITASHLVQVPVAGSPAGVLDFLVHPEPGAFARGPVWGAAVTLALVASLETLLNLEAVDDLDHEQRHSNPNRELVAQGVGNLTAGLIGSLPVTSVIVRSSVNIQAGGRTRLSTIVHGVLLATSVVFLPHWINRIPLSALAAILLVTGLKLATPKLFVEMWRQGRGQFLPFVLTVLAILLTDLLTGILIGLAIAIGFILRSNMRSPLRRVLERHVGGEVMRIELANQVSFLNRAAISRALDEVPDGGHVMIDAAATDYIDSDVLVLIRDFQTDAAPSRSITVSLRGFRDDYEDLSDRVLFADYASREVQSSMSPKAALDILAQGNARFRSGERLTRDLTRQMTSTSQGQFPFAAILSCIDSRVPVELLFDLGLGDIFSVRIAGNVARQKVIGSLEYCCQVAGSKLILVMGHTSCGAVNAALDLRNASGSIRDVTGCDNLEVLIGEIQAAIPHGVSELPSPGTAERRALADDVARRNVLRTIRAIRQESGVIDRLVREGRIGIAGAMYDVHSGAVEILPAGDEVPALAGFELTVTGGALVAERDR